MRVGVTVALFGAVVGCQQDVARPVQPLTMVAVEQRRLVKVATKADILFVVDDSPSMAPKIDRMAQAFGGFVSALDALDPPVDYQVAVTTTSVGERFGSCAPPDGKPSAQCSSDWYAQGFSCDSGGACWRPFDDRAGVLYAAPGNPAILHKGDMPPDQLAQALGQNLHVHLDGARQTRAYEAIQLAVQKNPAFVRAGAKLVVMIVTDTDDCSDPAHRTVGLSRDPDGSIVDNCKIEAAKDDSSSLLMPLSSFLDWAQGLRDPDGSRHEVDFDGVIDLANGSMQAGVCSSPTCEMQCDSAAAQAQCNQQCATATDVNQCALDCDAQCHEFCSGQDPSVRYTRLFAATDGVFDTICAASYGPALFKVAQVVGIPTALGLKATPTPPESLLVQVQRAGATITCAPGMDYTVSNGNVVLAQNGACRLLPGDTYDVRYLTTP